jgi:hypothetical protein
MATKRECRPAWLQSRRDSAADSGWSQYSSGVRAGSVISAYTPRVDGLRVNVDDLQVMATYYQVSGIRTGLIGKFILRIQ